MTLAVGGQTVPSVFRNKQVIARRLTGRSYILNVAREASVAEVLQRIMRGRRQLGRGFALELGWCVVGRKPPQLQVAGTEFPTHAFAVGLDANG